MSNGNSRYLNIGPGGRRCNCCFPAPGSKDRRAQFRSAKRKADRDARRQIENDLIDHQEMMRELQNWEDDVNDRFDDIFENWERYRETEDQKYSWYNTDDHYPYYEYDDWAA